MSTKKKMISYTLDTLPPISQEDWDEMKMRAARPDDDIDISDIPELTAERMKDAVRVYVNGQFRPPALRKKRAA